MIYDLPDRVPQGGFEPLEVESIDCNKNRQSLNRLYLFCLWIGGRHRCATGFVCSSVESRTRPGGRDGDSTQDDSRRAVGTDSQP